MSESPLLVQAEEYARNYVNDDDVFPEDRKLVRDILKHVFVYDKSLPRFKVEIKRVGNHYSVIIKGWTTRLLLLQFSERFCDPWKRDERFKRIYPDAVVLPDEPGGPCVILRIVQSAAPLPDFEKYVNDYDPPTRNPQRGGGNNLADTMGAKLVTRRLNRENTNDDEVDAADKEYVEQLLCDVLEFDPTLLPVKVHIARDQDHYNCLISNWHNEIPVLFFTRQFLDKESRRRPRKYDPIMSTAAVVPEDTEEGGPYVVICITAGFYSTRSVSDPQYKRRR